MKVVKKLTKGDVVKIVLETVKVSGILATALVAPNALIAMKKIGIINLDRSKKQAITTARLRLQDGSYLKRNAKGLLQITEKGEEKLRKLELANYELVIPRIWDKKWRILIFDIPEYRRGLREKIRNTLRSIGFVRIQDSVWVYPYDCADLVALLKADFKVGKDLLYLTVEEIENDRELKKHFNLI